MKVLLLNGSPHEAGCTFTALSEVAGALNASGVETEIMHVIKNAKRGCISCGACHKQKLGRCAFGDDGVNDVLDKMEQADGMIIGSPVYYAAPNGALLGLLDRVFYAGSAGMAFKPGAAVVSARRAGTTAALDVLNKYFLIAGMPIAPSQYWNMVHGSTPDDVRQDGEGMQIMRTLGRNMAWMIKAFQGSEKPAQTEAKVRTNFIR